LPKEVVIRGKAVARRKDPGRSIEEVHPSAAKSAVLVEKIGQPPTLKA
jgi:hypothetical protein